MYFNINMKYEYIKYFDINKICDLTLTITPNIIEDDSITDDLS